MSISHCVKSLAETRLIPGGRDWLTLVSSCCRKHTIDVGAMQW